MKDLQEMNLVDDFLVNSLTSHKTYGESASRYILECIFRRKIGKLTEKETLFLYTKGTKGDPPRELRELLRYMEDSTEENAGSEGLKTLHRMVTEVKRDGEVGFAYMKSFEREQRVREEARQEGLSEGRREGLSEGLDKGRTVGLSEGKAEALLTVLECKGEVPEPLRRKILAEKDLTMLNDWLLRALACESVQKFAATLKTDL